MTDQHVIIDAGTLQFGEEDLTATGILVPFGVKARSNLGEFTVDAGVFTLPADTTGASLNIEHQREDVVGGIAKAWEQTEGIAGTFKFADTEEGRKAFADAKSGKRKNLSAEVAKVRVKDGKAIAGRLFAAALVEKPAFEGATLLAAEDTTADLIVPDEQSTDPEHLLIDADSLPEDITVATPDGETTTYTPEATPAEDNPEGGSTVTATATEPGQQAPAVVPSTLLASAPTAPAPEKQAEPDVDYAAIFSAMGKLKKGMADADAETMLAALSDIKYNTAGGLTTAASGVLQPAWVGRLWQGKRYQRKYLDLFTHLFGGIQLGGRKGFTLNQGTALVTKWAGNKSDIPSGAASTGTKSATIQPYGYGADVAREWYDLEGGADVLQAFFEGVVDSYAKVTDEDALAAIYLAASKTSADLDRLVAPETFPTEYPEALGMVIQAIEAVSDADDDAASVIVNPVAWTQLLYTPKDLVPEFVSFGVTAGTGTAEADGKVVVKKAAQSFFTGLNVAEPAVVGGSKSAIEFREQGTTPIQIDALNVAKGGIDRAVIGYLETFVVRPESLVLIGTAAV